MTSILRLPRVFSLVGFFQCFVVLKWFLECCGEAVLQSCDNTCPWFNKSIVWTFRAVQWSSVGGCVKSIVTLWYTILAFKAVCSYLFKSQCLLLTLCCWALPVAYNGCAWSGTKWRKLLHKSEGKIIFTESRLVLFVHEATDIPLWFVSQRCFWMIREWWILKNSEGTKVT